MAHINWHFKLDMLTKIILIVVKYLEHVLTATKYSGISLKDFAEISVSLQKIHHFERLSHLLTAFFSATLGKMYLV